MSRCATSCSVRALALGRRHSHQLQRIGDVVEGAHPGKQRLAVVLEHVAEFDLPQPHAVEQDLAGVERDQPRDHVDQGALAAAVRPEHRDHLAARNVEIEVVVDDGLAEALAQAPDGDVRPLCGRLARLHRRHARRPGSRACRRALIADHSCRLLLSEAAQNDFRYSVTSIFCAESRRCRGRSRRTSADSRAASWLMSLVMI